MAQIKKCPLCGGDVLGNYCFSCGVDLPDEEELSRRANPEPARQYNSTQTPGAVVTEEANRSDYPRVEVADNGWHTSSGSANSPNSNINANNNTAYRTPGYTPPPEQFGQYQQSGQFQQSGQSGQYQQSGQAGQTSGFAAWSERYVTMGFGEKFRRYWWYIILMLLVPGLWIVPGIVGLVGVVNSNRAAQKFGGEQLILALIGLFIFG
jgi:hypothetical protein